MKRTTVLIAFGGESSEHEVSLKSARNVIAAIDTKTYDALLCYIDRDGRWWLMDEWTESPDTARTTQLVVAPGTSSVLIVPGSKAYKIDVLFPVLHGKHGEDGTIQGLADIAHIPVVGPGVEASALCMDKHATKRMLQAADIPVAPWVTARPQDDIGQVITSIKAMHRAGPWFVKPSRAGSSLGVSRVTDEAALSQAIAAAFEHDDLVLIEAAVSGRELEVALLGNVPHQEASGVGEVVSGGDFYDYDQKYSSDSTSQTVITADLPADVKADIRELALKAYEVLGCKGLSRIDFLLDADSKPYVMEVNTLPGFTDISMYPKLWGEQGVSYDTLVDRLIQLALK